MCICVCEESIRWIMDDPMVRFAHCFSVHPSCLPLAIAIIPCIVHSLIVDFWDSAGQSSDNGGWMAEEEGKGKREDRWVAWKRSIVMLWIDDDPCKGYCPPSPFLIHPSSTLQILCSFLFSLSLSLSFSFSLYLHFFSLILSFLFCLELFVKN